MDKVERSWILNDWANSAYSVAITTAILPIYFKDVAARGLDANLSTALWGYGNTAATLVASLLAPVLGTLADFRGFKKPSFAAFTLLGVVATALLACAGPGDWKLCLVLYAFSALGFSCMNIFYDAFLVDVTVPARYDWVSSAGFAWGYIGSTIPFMVSIALILKPEWAGLPSRDAATRVSFLITAAWWGIFAIPLLRNVKQTQGIPSTARPVRDSFLRLSATFRELGRFRAAFLFLVAYFFFIDGISSLIKMSAVFGRDIGIPMPSLLGMILVLQFVAFPFSLAFGKLAERFSARWIILAGILIFLGVTCAAPWCRREWQFWVLTLLMGTSLGGVQSLSRSEFGRLIPRERATEFFGFFNVSGKFAALFGPFSMALLTQVSGNPRLATLALVPFFAVGGGLLFLQRGKLGLGTRK